MTGGENGNFSASEYSFFIDKDVVSSAIRVICDDSQEKEWEKQWGIYDAALTKYQEQPLLLNPSLEELMKPLCDRLLHLSSLLVEEGGGNLNRDAAYNVNSTGLYFVCRCIQLLCRVRGYKHILRFFPHEVFHLEMNMSLLKAQDRNDYERWEIRYVLLLWLSILCLIPFDIFSLDSSRVVNDSSGKSLLVSKIFSLGQSYLYDSGPSRDAATFCLSSLLTRPDMDNNLMMEYMKETYDFIHMWSMKGDEANAELNADYFKLVGSLNCIALVFKKGHRANLLNCAREILKYCLLLTKQTNQTVIRKLCTKIFQRIGMAFLPPQVASWRYQRGHRSLQLNLTDGAAGMAGDTGSTSGSGANTSSSSGGITTLADEEDEEDIEDDIVLEMEEIIEQLLCSLRDKDTIVRWSAAKGLGRTSMRLPKLYADDVVESILEHFHDMEDDGAWHGACLALAELSRRGLLLPERLECVVPIVEKAVHFDIVRGQHSVGSHVRDAACYVCWAFARAYSPEIMKPFISRLTSAMLLTALYDREINCRRAASAAFQENVGRQGNENFKFGIEIITLADYFSVGNRTSSYTKVAPSVAALDESYLTNFFVHLSQTKIFHWDEEIRSIAAQGLAQLVPVHLGPQLGLQALKHLLPCCTSKVFSTRHGAVVGISSLIFALSLSSTIIPMDIMSAVVDVVPALDKARLFRGRGGELMRTASCELVENIARSNLKLSQKMQENLLEKLTENLSQPHEIIQRASAKALRCFLFVYFPLENGSSATLQRLTVKKYLVELRSEHNVAVTRGFSLALGVLPAKLILQSKEVFFGVFEALEDYARQDKLITGEPDIETRRNALEAIVEITERVRPYVGRVLPPSIYSRVFSILFAACEDYSIDKRGDTGSWCRKLALMSIERLIYCVSSFVLSIYSLNLHGNPTFSMKENNIAQDDLINIQVYTELGVGTLRQSNSLYVDVEFPAQSLYYNLSTTAATSTSQGCLMSFHKESVFYLTNTQDSTVETSNVDIPYANDNSPSKFVEDVASSNENSCMVAFNLDSRILTESVNVILKQMAEKLDSVREVSGNIFARLLNSRLVLAHNFVDGMILTKALMEATSCRGPTKDEMDHVNWSNPAFVFPFLCRILESDHYFYSIMSGWVIAMGGLTEAVVKESSRSMIEYSRFTLKNQDGTFVTKLATTLLQLLYDFENADRVKIPTFKTLVSMMKSGCMNDYFNENYEWVTKLLSYMKHEISSTGDLKKLLVCIDVLIHVLDITKTLDHKTLISKQIVVLTGHKYPRIRKYAAEQLYLQCLSSRLDYLFDVSSSASATATETNTFDDKNRPKKDIIISIVIETVWDGSITTARDKRTSLFALFGWTAGKSGGDKNSKNRQKKEKQVEDELDSYESLVREAGY